VRSDPAVEGETTPAEVHDRPAGVVDPLWARLLVASPLCAAGAVVGAATALSWLLVVGGWGPLTALPAALLGAAVVGVPTWLVVGRAGSSWPAGRRDVLAVVLLWLAVLAWVAVNVPYVSEHLFVGRDPAVYTLTALWLVDGPGVQVPVGAGEGGSLGFQERGGVLFPQGSHAAPALAAVLGMVVGDGGVLAANLLLGGTVLLALHAVTRPLAGPFLALLPMAALAASAPFLYVARGLYSEPVSSVTVLFALALGLHAWRSGSGLAWVLLGAGIGASGTTRIDAVAVLVGLLPVLAYRGITLGSGRDRWRPIALASAGAAPGLVAGRLDLQLNSPLYLADLAPETDLLWTGVVAAAVASVVLLLLPSALTAPVLRVLERPRVASGAALVLLGVFAVLASRPLWYTNRSSEERPFVTGLQAEAGVAQDPFQMYAELSMTWLSWYHGWIAVSLGVFGLCLMLRTGLLQRHEVLLLVAVVLPSLVLYLIRPGIFPDQMWATRRYMVLAVPGLLVAGTWLLSLAWRRAEPAGRTVLWAVVAAVLAAPVGALPGLFGVVEGGGSVASAGRLCATVDGRPVVLTGRSAIASTLRIVCGSDVVVLPDAGPGARTPVTDVQAAVARLGTDAVVVTVDPGTLWDAGTEPVPAVDSVTTRWDRTLLHAPRVGVSDPKQVWVVEPGDLTG
jgi:hypothetical protein